MTYKLLPNDLVRLDFGDYVQTLTKDELDAYMVPLRDSDPDLYAALVHVRVLMG